MNKPLNQSIIKKKKNGLKIYENRLVTASSKYIVESINPRLLMYL